MILNLKVHNGKYSRKGYKLHNKVEPKKKFNLYIEGILDFMKNNKEKSFTIEEIAENMNNKYKNRFKRKIHFSTNVIKNALLKAQEKEYVKVSKFF